MCESWFIINRDITSLILNHPHPILKRKRCPNLWGHVNVTFKWTYWQDPWVPLGLNSHTILVATCEYMSDQVEKCNNWLLSLRSTQHCRKIQTKLTVKLVPKLVVSRSWLYQDCWSASSSNLHAGHNRPIHVASHQEVQNKCLHNALTW